MEREERYIVIKISDLEKGKKLGHLTDSNITTLDHILSKIWWSRIQRGKEDLKTVVVEHDWPEYERVWEMLEHRSNKEADLLADTLEEYNKGKYEAECHIANGQSPCHLKGISPYCNGWNDSMNGLYLEG